MVIPYKLDNAYSFSNGKAEVLIKRKNIFHNDKKLVIDKEGNVIGEKK